MFAPIAPSPIAANAQSSGMMLSSDVEEFQLGFPLSALGNHVSSLLLPHVRGNAAYSDKSGWSESPQKSATDSPDTEINIQRILQAKALAASKSHSEAERRRRERINSHFSTLRTLLPAVTKSDKASLLAEVIHQVKELKRQAEEIAKTGPVPSDIDELKVEEMQREEDDEGKLSGRVLKATLCCDDRSNLTSDLLRTLHDTLGLKILKAEMCSVVGRAKYVFLVQKKDEEPSANDIAGALRAIIEKASASAFGNCTSNKRQRVLPH